MVSNLIQELWKIKNFTPNDEQRKAILFDENKPMFITAAPGSGKTRVLLWRTVYLIVDKKISPDQIFLSTFTEKAAHQLKEGLKELLGIAANFTNEKYDLARMYVGTIHSNCHRVLLDRKFSVTSERQVPPRVLDELGQYLYIYNQRFGLKQGPVVIGLQKGGYVAEYMSMLQKRIPDNLLLSISDDFRYNYLGTEPSDNGFGSETYYGHDFVFKTPSGKLFVFALPYPFQSKSTANFVSKKVKLEKYPALAKALRLITEVETDLCKNALAPIALAHKYTAISLRPGGRALDLLGRASVG